MPGSPPASLPAIAARTDARLALLLADEREKWTALDPQLARPVDEISRLVLSGGKRLRPAFCHWGHIAAGGSPDSEMAVNAGAALELMHAFALFHDDIMDDAATRRGQPTTHVIASEEHRSGGWVGESRRFGEGVAILVGDLAFVYADQLMEGAPPAAWHVWNELRAELNVGQYLDIVGSVQSNRAVETADRICRYKSGKYTIERPLHLGALLAAPERGAELLPHLSNYGLPLGDAFQMRDDVMGAFGNEASTGKPVGADLREGKPTPLLARAARRSDDDQIAVLDRVGDLEMDDYTVNRIQQVIVETGALDELEALIADLVATAVGSLADAPIAAEAVEELTELAHYVSARRT